MTLIHPMCYKPKIFTDKVLQCVFDKYKIIYQNIWEKGILRPHLAESGYCRTLGLVKGASILHHFSHKKYF